VAKKPNRSSRVPTGRLERLARIGLMTGEFALGGASEGVKRILGQPTGDASVFLSADSAERLAKHLSHMRGAAMKIGQMLSLVDDQLLPPEFAEALSILRASADMMPEGQVRKALRDGYGSGWENGFESFDFEPIAAASIGQVHTATLQDGREVALKIQYPGVAESIDSDVDNLAFAFKAARILPMNLELDPLIEEAKSQLRQEADYQAEAGFLERYGELLRDDSRYVVPRVIHEHTTSGILAMERLYGVPIEDLAGPEHPQERRDEMGERLLELIFRELFDFQLMQTDPNFSNYLLMPDNHTLGLLDLGSAKEIHDEYSEVYRLLFHSIRHDDRDEMLRALVAMHFLREDEPEEIAERYLDFFTLVFEHLAKPGLYDFAASDLFMRARDMGMELVFKHGLLRAPPAETMFIQRKLDGTFMLCGRIKARVDVQAILDRVLGAGGAHPDPSESRQP
jgi:aarF domain-containing kinase